MAEATELAIAEMQLDRIKKCLVNLETENKKLRKDTEQMEQNNNELHKKVQELSSDPCISYDTSVAHKNIKLAWTGDFQSVKDLFAEYFQLNISS